MHQDYLDIRPDWADEISFTGLVYHGSMLTPDDEAIWTDISSDLYSDWEAVWVTPDEPAAEEFATRWIGNQPEVGQVPFVIRLAADFPNLLDLLTDLPAEASEFRDEWCDGDIRECIDHFHRWGFDGWITDGSIGKLVYRDIAVWNGTVGGTEVKIMLPDGKWSPYMSEEEANQLLDFAE